MSASLVSSVRLDSEPVAALNTSSEPPFATVDFTRDRRTYISVHTPGEARALAAAFRSAADLLKEHAAKNGMCPQCWSLLPGHALTCPLIPAGPEHPAGTQACGLRPGTPHEPHGTCPGTAPEFLSEHVIPAAEAAGPEPRRPASAPTTEDTQ